MKKIFFLLIIISWNISFSFLNEIKLKKDPISPFKTIRIYSDDGKYKDVEVKQGSYKIILFSVNYPSDVISKNKFYNEINEFLNSIQLSKKYNIILEQSFFKDLEEISSFELIDDEKIIEKPASSLTFEEKEILNSMTSEIKFIYYNNTDQEYLNRQIYLLYKILEKDNYNTNNIYSEFEKEELISELRNKRKKIADNLKKSNLELFVRESFDKVYFKNNQNNNPYIFDNDIIISENISDLAILPNISNNVYLTNIDDSTLIKLVNNEIKLKRKIVIVENNQFTGYNFNDGNVVIFVNNSKNNSKDSSEQQKIFIYDNKNYQIDVFIENTTFNQLKNKNSNYYISDFF